MKADRKTRDRKTRRRELMDFCFSVLGFSVRLPFPRRRMLKRMKVDRKTGGKAWRGSQKLPFVCPSFRI
jgi:hypothetical protein